MRGYVVKRPAERLATDLVCVVVAPSPPGSPAAPTHRFPPRSKTGSDRFGRSSPGARHAPEESNPRPPGAAGGPVGGPSTPGAGPATPGSGPAGPSHGPEGPGGGGEHVGPWPGGPGSAGGR